VHFLGRRIDQRNKDLHQRAWIRVAYSELSAKFHRPLLHISDTYAEAVRREGGNVIFDAFAVVSHRNS
jgi:hypothetical protein